MLRLYHRLKAMGLCPVCGRDKNLSKYTLCDKCRLKQQIENWTKKALEKHPELAIKETHHA